jgi:transcriptional antiterminator RfaH
MGWRQDSVNAASSNPTSSEAWFCLRSQIKREHIAARHLRLVPGIEVFVPRIRFRRGTRHGTVWVTEALFPNYLFARFDWRSLFRLVHHAPGVATIVHFGNRWPTVPAPVVGELQRLFGDAEIHLVPSDFSPGESVRIAGGAFHGLEAVVQQAMPGRQRVQVLLEFLGRQTAVEVPVSNLTRAGNERKALL